MIDNVKFNNLLSYLKSLEKVAIAFSGGVDSTLLVKACQMALKDNVLAISMKTPYIPAWEIEEAVNFTREHNIRHKLFDIPFLHQLKENRKDRCYWCKSHLFKHMLSEAHKEGFTTVNISGKLLSFASKLDDSKSDEASMLEKISGIRILSVEDKELNKGLNFYKELDADGFFKNNKYESLMEVTDKDQVVRFYGRSGEKGKLSELLLVVGGNDNTLISIRGVINPDDISKLTGSLDLGVKTK